PQFVAENDDALAAGSVLRGCEIAPLSERLRAEQGEEVGRDFAANDSFRLAHASQAALPIGISGDALDRLALLLPVKKVRAKDQTDRVCFRHLLHPDQSF